MTKQNYSVHEKNEIIRQCMVYYNSSTKRLANGALLKVKRIFPQVSTRTIKRYWHEYRDLKDSGIVAPIL